MKICIAQTNPVKGDISANIETHINIIELSLTLNAHAIFFPELSLTGYEPKLAEKLSTDQNDNRLDIFQEICDQNDFMIGLGLPTNIESKVQISMIIFIANRPRKVYSKQILHSDEFPYFESGTGQEIITLNDTKIAPAICYESLQSDHAEKAHKMGANVYLASVAKPANGVEKACKHYPAIAKQYGMPVLMANSIGFCDNFSSVGKSALWTKKGKLIAQLDDKSEGILIYDTESESAIEKKFYSDGTRISKT